MRAKKKEIDGIEYLVLGSTIEREGLRIVRQSWTTTRGIVVCERGRYSHPGISAEEEHANRRAEEGRTANDPDEPYKEW